MPRNIRNRETFLLGIAGLITALLVGFWIGRENQEELKILLWMILGGVFLGVIVKPFLGIVLIISSLPIIDILPPVPLASSFVSMLGGVTLISYFIQFTISRQRKKTPFSNSNGLLWGLAFVGWIFLTNPAAALLPGDDDRVWLFTFVQLLILAWLVGRLLDTPKKHLLLMGGYSIAAVISAVFAIQQGYVGETIKESVRSAGLAGGANTAARYFVVGLIFLYFLQGVTRRKLLRLFSWLGIGILVYGTLVTVSRTGLLLLVASLGLPSIQRWGGRGRSRGVIVFMIAIGVTWAFADNILAISRSILPAIREGTDTVGIRYALWQSGLKMWFSSPVWGVGIGQFSYYLQQYGGNLLVPRYWGLGAHNMYIQVLAETGLVGLVLFLGFLGTALINLGKMSGNGTFRTPLAQIWLMVFIIMLLGGITKHDHYDKLIWMSAGIGVSPFMSAVSSSVRTSLMRKHKSFSCGHIVQVD